MPEKPISLGSVLLTLIEPHAGHAVAYNRWYEDDHLYAILLGPSAIAGARFVARREDKARRRVLGGIDPSPGSLLAVYWLIGDGRDHGEWRVTNVARLSREGRFYEERDMVYGYAGPLALTMTRPGCQVPVELALDHRFGHLALTVIQLGADQSGAEASRGYREALGPVITAPGSPVSLVTGFLGRRAADPRGRAGPAEPPAGADALVVLWFCDRDPAPAWDDLVSAQEGAVAARGAGRVVWTSPFVATVVGTDAVHGPARGPRGRALPGRRR